MGKFARRLFEPVDIASIVYFRVAFGVLLLIEVWRYFDNGWIERYYIEPDYHFTYYGFDWVRPWPDDGMYLHFYVLGLLALCIAAGFCYRLATALFFLGFTYVFLLEQARYLNHFYLISLISFLLIFITAHQALSLDALRRPDLRSDTAPAWMIWVLRAQLGFVYFYAGLAKVNADWLGGEPMRTWFGSPTEDLAFSLSEEWMVYAFSYGGLLLDLLVVPFLVWRRTRLIAFAAATLFHVLNSQLFSIGIFPWFMIAATLLFFEPDWPRRVLARARRRARGCHRGEAAPVEPRSIDTPPKLTSRQTLVVTALAIYTGVQLVVPLRHYLYPGDVNWTEEGHRFSWHMLLRDKDASVRFIAHDPDTQASWEIDPRDRLTRGQYRKMATVPDMILQFSHHLAGELREQGRTRVEIRARVYASLNGRRDQFLVDPEIDLANQARGVWPSSWITPLDAKT